MCGGKILKMVFGVGCEGGHSQTVYCSSGKLHFSARQWFLHYIACTSDIICLRVESTHLCVKLSLSESKCETLTLQVIHASYFVLINPAAKLFSLLLALHLVR